MTRILESKGLEIPVIIDTLGRDYLYIKLRIFDENGRRTGAARNTIDRDDAKRLAENILKWLEETKEIV